MISANRRPRTRPPKRNQRWERAAAEVRRQGHILFRIGPPSRSRARGRRSRARGRRSHEGRRPRPPTKPPRIRVKRSGRADIRMTGGGTERRNQAPDESRSGGTVGRQRPLWVRNARTRKRRTPLNLNATRNPWNAETTLDRELGGERKPEPKRRRDPPLPEPTKTKDREAPLCQPLRKWEIGTKP